MELYLLTVDSVEQILEIGDSRVWGLEIRQYALIIDLFAGDPVIDVLDVGEDELLAVL